jgi:2-polyprenyl-3-methyl-5-hydroxy-6-metoxy-1,4-benzoquinol methylase
MTPDEQQSAADWDAFAPEYVAAQQASQLPFVAAIQQVLQEKQLLQNRTVADIGGGAGRFAVPFAQVAQQVTIYDFSAVMLQYAQQFAKQQQVANVITQQATLSSLLAANRSVAEVAFAHMLPGLAPTQLPAFSRLAKQTVALSRITKQTDDFFAPLAQRFDQPALFETLPDLTLMAAYQQQLRRNQVQFQQRQWDFPVTETWTQAELQAAVLPLLNFQQQQALLPELTAHFQQQQQLQVTQTYQVTLLIWPGTGR